MARQWDARARRRTSTGETRVAVKVHKELHVEELAHPGEPEHEDARHQHDPLGLNRDALRCPATVLSCMSNHHEFFLLKE